MYFHQPLPTGMAMCVCLSLDNSVFGKFQMIKMPSEDDDDQINKTKLVIVTENNSPFIQEKKL